MSIELNIEQTAEKHLSAYLSTATVFNASLSELKKNRNTDFTIIKTGILELISLLKQDDRFLMGFANTPYSVILRKVELENANPDVILYGLNSAIYSLAISIEIGVPDEHLTYIGIASLCNHVGVFFDDSAVHVKELTATTEISKSLLTDLFQKISIAGIDMESLYLLSGLINDNKKITNKTSVQESMYQYAILISLCNSFEKLMHKTVKGDYLAPTDVMKNLRDNMDSYFNKNIIKIFFNKLSIYPVGTFVRLNTRETAKIVNINNGLIMRPELIVVLDSEDLEKFPPVRINLKERPTLYIKHSLVDEMLSEKYLTLF